MRSSDWSSDVCSSDLVGRDASDKPFGGLNRAVMVEMVEDEAELVAPHAGKAVRRTDESAQDLRCVDERRIAGQAAVAVVDRLPVIELDLEKCRGLAVAACMASHPPQLGENAAAIGERRQRVAVVADRKWTRLNSH